MESELALEKKMARISGEDVATQVGYALGRGAKGRILWYFNSPALFSRKMKFREASADRVALCVRSRNDELFRAPTELEPFLSSDSSVMKSWKQRCFHPIDWAQVWESQFWDHVRKMGPVTSYLINRVITPLIGVKKKQLPIDKAVCSGYSSIYNE